MVVEVLLLPLSIEKDRSDGLFCDGFLPLLPYYWDLGMKVTCPKCGYTWNYRGSKRFITCPNCLAKFKNPSFSIESGSSRTSTTTTTTKSLPEQVREIIVVLSSGRKVKLLCTRDLGACDVVEPGDLSDEELVEALGKVYGAAFRVEEKSGDGVKVLVLSGET